MRDKKKVEKEVKKEKRQQERRDSMKKKRGNIKIEKQEHKVELKKFCSGGGKSRMI